MWYYIVINMLKLIINKAGDKNKLLFECEMHLKQLISLNFFHIYYSNKKLYKKVLHSKIFYFKKFKWITLSIVCYKINLK